MFACSLRRATLPTLPQEAEKREQRTKQETKVNLDKQDLWVCGADGASKMSIQQIIHAVNGGMNLAEVHIVTTKEEADAYNKKQETMKSIVALMGSLPVEKLNELRDTLRGVTKWPWENMWLFRFSTGDPDLPGKLYIVRGDDENSAFSNMCTTFLYHKSFSEVQALKDAGCFELLGQVGERCYTLDV